LQKRLNQENKTRKYLLVLLVLILLALLLFLLSFLKPFETKKGTYTQPPAENHLNDKDSLDTASTSPDTASFKDSAAVAPDKTKRHHHKKDTLTADTAKSNNLPDTLTLHHEDSATINKTDSIVDPCKTDTTSLWVYPDPSGGLHKKTLQVYFVSNKPAIIEWKFENESDWKQFAGNPITIDVTATIEFRAKDSCGRQLEKRAEYYEIERAESIQYCPDGMEYIKVGANKYCIDRYEWPNRKKAEPLSYISKYGASDSCYSVGKRLCSAEEWMIACMGPYSWKYPYGQVYEGHACSTNDTAVRVSGSKPECRSFFGVYDMSGGLAEWTDTRAVENQQFYYVKGGFWESGPQSSCFDKRYSYYPQNRHNPVGFRCCQDTLIKSEAKR
jgi:hypothetical protein